MNQAKNNECTPLFIAVQQGHAEVAQLLLEHGADVSKAGIDGRTLLFFAAEKGLAAVAQLLLERGADVNQADVDGCTPLLIAARKGRTALVQLLLDHDADVNKATDNGCAPLLFAAEKGHAEVARLLLAAPGIKVNQAEEDGWTPLLIAAEKGYTEVARLLLNNGVDVNQAKNNGCTPLYLAAQNGYAEVVWLLIAAPGIKVNQAKNGGCTPLNVASRNSFSNIVALLNACSGDGKQRDSAFRSVDLSGKKAVIHYYINMNKDLLAAALFKSLEPEDRIKLIRAIAPSVNKQYRNLRNFSLVCKEYFNAAASNKANIFYNARDEFSLFQEEKINDTGNFSFKLPKDLLRYVSQFLFVASKYQRKQISMIGRLWRWHNTGDTLAAVPGEAESTLGNDFSKLKVE